MANTMANQAILNDVHEVASLLHLSEDRLRRKVKDGMIPYVRVGGKLLFWHTDVQEYIDRCQAASEREMRAHAAGH